MPARRLALALLLGLTVVAAVLVVAGPHHEDGRVARGVSVTEVDGVVHAAQAVGTRAPALALLLLAVLGVAAAASPPRAWRTPTEGATGHRPHPVLLRALAGRAHRFPGGPPLVDRAGSRRPSRGKGTSC